MGEEGLIGRTIRTKDEYSVEKELVVTATMASKIKGILHLNIFLELLIMLIGKLITHLF